MSSVQGSMPMQRMQWELFVQWYEEIITRYDIFQIKELLLDI